MTNYLVKALSEGIQDAGVRHFANYPGFHSNELHAALGARVTSTDEKNAFAFGWGCSMAGERAAVSFKNVGLNDAADAYLGAHFVGCRAGLVLFLFDDCDIQHSQNRIDVRPYSLIYGGLWLEPRSVPEAYRFARDAFGLSERFGLPVTIRVTNILWDQGLVPSEWDRAPLPTRRFDSVERETDVSRWVVHPSEARRMEAELARKNAEIAQWVESAHADQPRECDSVIAGARRGVSARSPFRTCTLPLPAEAIRRVFAGRSRPDVYEHGPTPFVAERVDAILDDSPRCPRHCMAPVAALRPKYHCRDGMEKLFAAIRSVPDALVSGDLGGYTMDPARTLQFCLCYGVAPAVAMGLAEASPEGRRIFCIAGDGAYLHSGQACLHEMAARAVNVSVFVFENGGTLGTGGQWIPGDLGARPASVRFHELDLAAETPEGLRAFVDALPRDGVDLTIVHTHENIK